MTRANPADLVEIDNEIDRTFHQRLRGGIGVPEAQEVPIEDRASQNMAEPRRTLSEYERPQFIGDEFSVQVLMSPFILHYTMPFK